MKKLIFTPVILLVLLMSTSVKAQMGIGTATPNAAAQLDVSSTSKGFLAPRMTKFQRDAISPVTSASKGLLIYQTDNTPGFYYYDGTAWFALSSSGAAGVDLTTAQSIGGLKTFTSNDGLLATGTNGLGTASSLGEGTRMMWYPKKSAFRAGYIFGTAWDDVNIGNYSVAMGSNTTASNYFSTAMGQSSTASGNTSTAIGGFNKAEGSMSIALGVQTTASGTASTAMGQLTTSRSYAETVIGISNTDYTPTSTNAFYATDRLFVIGNGTSSSALSNALVMLKNGNTTFSGTVTATVVAPTSDARLKRSIVPLKNSIEAIMQLKPVSYEKKNSLASTEYNITENGFIAQELQKVMPSLVVEGTDKDKLLSVNYTAIIPVLTKAIQEQQATINSLEKTAKDQQNQISELKKMVEQLLKK